MAFIIARLVEAAAGTSPRGTPDLARVCGSFCVSLGPMDSDIDEDV